MKIITMSLAKAFCVGLLVIPSFAWGSPVYLKCEAITYMTDNTGDTLDFILGSTQKFSVRLDESSGDITHTSHGPTLSGDTEFNAEGFFAATTIAYQIRTRIDEWMIVVEKYVIDRSDLSVTLEVITEAQKYDRSLENIKKRGSCEIVKTKKNKI